MSTFPHKVRFNMSTLPDFTGPLGGHPVPVHGGNPTSLGCDGCVDCCHLPEISITDEEATLLRVAYESDGEESVGELHIEPDVAHDGWQIMRGPCVFRRLEAPLVRGGCRIYDDRPAACRIFTCKLLLDFRRSQV